MKHITTNADGRLSGLDAPGVWDIEQAFASLKSAGLAETKRTAERRINALGFLPPLLTPESIRAETGEAPNRLVLDWCLEQARKRRDRVLFVQLQALPDHTPCLHANDARDARFWVPLADLSLATLIAALEQLQQHIGKALTLFPHGALTGSMRNVPLPDSVHVDLHAYPSPMPDLGKAGAKDRSLHASSHLKRLEAESIDIIREAVAEAQNPVMLYSIGKDSGVMLHLAKKAFYPALPPFPLLHVDTRWKFQDMYRFRDMMVRDSGMELLVHTNPDAIAKDINPFDHGSSLHTDITKTEGLKQALDAHHFDVIFGGARRDEEKSRAKERIFSFRTSTHRWDPKNQRPELWSLYNTRMKPDESMRVFPLSNWTELDIWQYILQEQIPVVPLYYAKPRPVIVRPDMIMLVDDARCRMAEGETITLKTVRFRTLGCYPLTGAVESAATSVEDIVLELINARQSERQGRKIDTDSAGSMEKKKQEGYF